MLLILLKSAACLAIFMAFYKLFLERENMHQFKRFYLLSALIVSFAIPFITFIKYVEPTLNVPYFNVDHSIPLELLPIEEVESEQPINYLPTILWSVYIIGALLFGTKFCLNLFGIVSKINNNEKQKHSNFISVLLSDLIVPHTFFNYIFLNKIKFETKAIPKEVLLHEQTHAKQKHSLDILFIELLQVVFWFNPLLYFIKKDIKLNHEFLADDAVLKYGTDSSTYQNMLLAFSTNATEPELANAINYSLIKKRFTIMKTQTSKRAVWLRSLLLLPLLGGLLFSFSSTKEVEKDITPLINISETPQELLESERQKNNPLTDLKEELQKTNSYKINYSPPKPKQPSKLQFEGWKNESLFALWLNGKQIKNSELDNLSNNDIVYYNSLLIKPEARNDKFQQPYQTHLYTKIGFEKAYNEPMEEKEARFEQIVSEALLENKKKLESKNSENTKLKEALNENINTINKYNSQIQNPILIINGIACERCELNLTKKGVENIILSTDTGENILSFKFKVPGKASVINKGDALNSKSVNLLKTLALGTSIQLFDIKTVNKTKLPPVIIKLVDKYDKTISKSPIVKKGEKSSLPPPPPPPAPVKDYKKMKAKAKVDLPPPPPPPAPKSPIDQVVLMAKKGADFYYNAEKISSDKAIEIVKHNSKLNLSIHTNNGKSTVHISNKPISVVNGRATISKERKEEALERSKVMMKEREKKLKEVKEKREVMYKERKEKKEEALQRSKAMMKEREKKLKEVKEKREMVYKERRQYRRSLAEQFKGMEANGSEFFYEGEKISEDKAITLIKENPKLNVSMHNSNGKGTIHLSKKGIKTVNGKLVKKEE